MTAAESLDQTNDCEATSSCDQIFRASSVKIRIVHAGVKVALSPIFEEGCEVIKAAQRW